MIELNDVSFWYHGQADPVLTGVGATIGEGELVLVAGRTGAGKSTLLGTVNGLVPHFTGGHLEGLVAVGGADTASHPPREFAHLVGVVGQDPLAGFVTDTVEEELAYGMEQLGLPPSVMRRRVEETLDLLGIADLRRRALRTLSGGQQQRVAIGSVLTMHPPVLVLDEPTSALDPTAAEDVLATLARLVHDLGTTVLLAEHRMERVVSFATGCCTCRATEPSSTARRPPCSGTCRSGRRSSRWACSPGGSRCPCPSGKPAGAPGRGARRCPAFRTFLPARPGRRCSPAATSWSGTARPSPSAASTWTCTKGRCSR
ncbi:ATP-binding cassette domain-containing protein [Sphaerisporangium sp. NPDC051017]|uniref:ATP-binding cassette domain-containing protein n=1 Tax=Sphaerisporangium sp. NPDC051017 TaxID=3154636 RepID=UPI003418510C